ncbi:hypothetical protein [Amycolatopsis tucumanensis]|uniref:Luciferase-like monooxygenase n=1 Tax=Amycolatopsis tucumanensis TaxID=401106 RepID=A0ABP7J8G6_9PSEU|nr:hypothetical protein [Amycolatopsis tucumanensis]MCF6421830.1 hypothetical protein [Amycolatopsis tucumanensis]
MRIGIALPNQVRDVDVSGGRLTVGVGGFSPVPMKRMAHWGAAGADYAQLTSSTVATSPGAITDAVTAFGDLGATDLVLIPATDNLDEVKRAVDAAL